MQAASSWEREREAVMVGELSPSLPYLWCSEEPGGGTLGRHNAQSREQTPSDHLQRAAVACVGSAPPALGWDCCLKRGCVPEHSPVGR